MNKLSLIGLGIFATVSAFSQSSNVTAAWNYMNYYNNGDGAQNLEKAKEAIDQAAVHEKNFH
jgi:hypothetical protein